MYRCTVELETSYKRTPGIIDFKTPVYMYIGYGSNKSGDAAPNSTCVCIKYLHVHVPLVVAHAQLLSLKGRGA